MAALTQEELLACNTPKLGGAIKELDAEFSDTDNLLNPNPKAIWVKNTGNIKIETIGGAPDNLSAELNPDPDLQDLNYWTTTGTVTQTNNGFSTSGSTNIFFPTDVGIEQGEDYNIELTIDADASTIAIYVGGTMGVVDNGTGNKTLTITAGSSPLTTGIITVGGSASFSSFSIIKAGADLSNPGSVITLSDVESDTLINWARIKKIFSTGTTASDIYGIY